MISWQEGKSIAETIYDYHVCEVFDLKDKWGYSYFTGESSIPGIPIVTISKADGSIDYLTIPPLENLDILEATELIYKFL